MVMNRDLAPELFARDLEKAVRGIEAADAREFADQSAKDRVRDKYRPANEADMSTPE